MCSGERGGILSRERVSAGRGGGGGGVAGGAAAQIFGMGRRLSFRSHQGVAAAEQHTKQKGQAGCQNATQCGWRGAGVVHMHVGAQAIEAAASGGGQVSHIRKKRWGGCGEGDATALPLPQLTAAWPRRDSCLRQPGCGKLASRAGGGGGGRLLTPNNLDRRGGRASQLRCVARRRRGEPACRLAGGHAGTVEGLGGGRREREAEGGGGAERRRGGGAGRRSGN